MRMFFLKRILVDGGYIENGQYHFYFADHLDNNYADGQSYKYEYRIWFPPV